ncbi:MAG TPA: DUF4907 domain-containing protein [Chitinophagaceae bacterium]|nr:DUF4907 domain-containing protein [Chitinophagaceae bacterium]
MMQKNKKYFSILLPALLMLLAGVIILLHKQHQQAAAAWLPVDVHPFKTRGGWGYEVLVDKKVFIHQDCIPAIAAYKQFNSAADALQVGKLVVEKIKKGARPALTVTEISNVHIRL